MTKDSGNGRVFVSKGVSAPPDWWEKVIEFSKENNINRSLLIRLAVDSYLKDKSVGTRQTLTAS
jgi:hypothetical protein